ncbi:MAG: CinA family nicotinamide mononucleotide deamidase-related protein [Ardenticatenia bacterium]|nr:CinA family nicotinamide mononucleotide deamidase-related protein [Ardenticatenia bacterium]
MNAEVITIGTELLLGQIVDTNAAWIARRLAEAGVNLYYTTTVGDNRRRIAEVIRHALGRVDVVLTTGGLGPTVDDVTREAIADVTGRPLVRRPEVVEHLERLFRRMGREPGENNLRQADVPEGARVLWNPIGTAPGFIVPHGSKQIIAMPGVPREMKRMMEEHVLPFLRELVGCPVTIRSKVLRTIGVGESAVDQRLADLMRLSNPTVGLAAHMGQVDVRITARAPGPHEAERMIAHVEREVRRRIGRWIYGEGDERIEEVVIRLVRQREETLALLETNTEGAIAHRLQQAEGDDQVVIHAEVIPPPEGNPDDAHATALATRLQRRSGSTWALVVWGTAGEDEGFYGQDVGTTLIALARPGGTPVTHRLELGGRDEHSRRWVANQALDTLRRALMAIS